MPDPYFDKPPEPPRPMISNQAAYALSASAAFCGFLVFACQQPELAGGMALGIGLLIVLLIILFFGSL